MNGTHSFHPVKYLGLVALNNIMQTHPKAVAEHRDTVLNCLDDEDVSIRMRALDLLEGMVNKKNLFDIIRKLVDHIQKTDNANFKDALIEKIVSICSKNSYQVLPSVFWSGLTSFLHSTSPISSGIFQFLLNSVT